ncbi:cardiolipin synthase [Paracoccus aerodenitrificans]|uniref:cardiolipin synthase n=1 Tax=Paracoccus aerodenitrificans TaxID=3017781 RepID=UPI0022F0EF6C|nr:cardiolipin synthase [Paracoccus aerodenitrificans]WBU64745.1 cardiolipin synthase [Paracoccus aerodenitrificans]
MTTVLATILAVFGALAVAYCVWAAIASARTPQGAAAWVVFLVSSPWFGVPAFLVLGRRKVRDYRAAWRESHDLFSIQDTEASRGTLPFEREKTLRALERIGGLPFTGGNEVRLLIDGGATFDAICAVVDSARESVCVQFYIIRDDGLGRRLADHLVAAAARGVKVRVMYDGVGSQKLPEAWAARLRDAGVAVLNPDHSRGPTSRLEINFRNHRKTVVVDGDVAFVGGHNVGDEYLGLDPQFGRWRDTHVEIRGPVAGQIQAVFAEDWHWASGESLTDDLPWEAGDATDPENATLAALVPTGPGDPIDSGSLMFFTAITAARDRIWIASPYFVPDTDIMSALVSAALSGRDVRILLPSTIDHYLPWLASHAYFDELRATGVRFFRYCDGFLHQKVILVDDDLAAVGTANLDNRSFRLNFESMVFVADGAFASDVERMLSDDFVQSDELISALVDQPLHIRISSPLARLWAPLL